MKHTFTKDWSTAMLLGSIAAMRSMLAPAIVCRSLRASEIPFLISPETLKKATQTASALELLADKSSFAIARTRALPLVGRILSGGASAFYATRGTPRHRYVAALLGAGAALLVSHAMYRARAFLSGKLGVPNTVAGLIEDSVALSAARLATHRLEARTA
jgi:uncharacterized membrane protein